MSLTIPLPILRVDTERRRLDVILYSSMVRPSRQPVNIHSQLGWTNSVMARSLTYTGAERQVLMVRDSFDYTVRRWYRQRLLARSTSR